MIMEKFELSETLTAQGFTFRPARLDDLEPTVELFNACSWELIGFDDKFTVEDVGLEWREPGFTLETDSRLVTSPDGRVVGYCDVWDPDDPHVTVFSWGRVHPEYTGLGIGTYMLEWAESRARQAIPKAPPGARVVLRTSVLSNDDKAQRLFQEAGFTLIRYFLRMVIDLDRPPPEPIWPEGITVRTMRVGQEERAVVMAVRAAFQDHWGYVEHTFEEEYARWLHFMKEENEDFEPSLWFLAMDSEEIAGVSLCRMKTNDAPDMGWVQTLGVRRPWRRRGLGLALLRHSFGEFYRRGRRKVGLGVDAQNLTGATRLYRKAGMRPDPERQISVFEKELRRGKDISTK